MGTFLCNAVWLPRCSELFLCIVVLLLRCSGQFYITVFMFVAQNYAGQVVLVCCCLLLNNYIYALALNFLEE